MAKYPNRYLLSQELLQKNELTIGFANYVSNDTSSSHNNGMEGEAVCSRSIEYLWECVCVRMFIYKYIYI